MDALLDYLRTAEPDLTIAHPGERGWQTRERNLRQGIPINTEIVEQLKDIGVVL